MKKTLLFAAAAVVAMSASAEFEGYYVERSGATAQEIPQAENVFLNLENSNVYHHPDFLPESGDAPALIVAPDLAADGTPTGKLEGMTQIGKLHNGDVVEFILKSTQNETGYQFTFHWGTKLYDGSIEVNIVDMDGNVLYNENVETDFTGEWNVDMSPSTFEAREKDLGKFGVALIQIEKDVIPADKEIKLQLIAHKNNPEKLTENIVNMRFLHFEAKDPVELYTLYTYVAVDGDNPNNAEGAAVGSITRNPAGTEFEDGTEVVLTAVPASNFKFAYFENTEGDQVLTNPYTVKMDQNQDITAYFTYVDPCNAIPGYLDPNTVEGATIRNWKSENTRGVCCVPLSAGIDTPAKEDYTAYPWPAGDGKNYGYDFDAFQSSAKGTGVMGFKVRAAEAGVDNLLIAISDKGKDGVTDPATVTINVYAGEEAGDEAVATGVAMIPRSYQDWNYTELKVDLDKALEAGVYYAQITATQSDSGRKVNVLYAAMGKGDNYGNWAEINPAGVENVVVDEAAEAPVRYYNLQGIEVNRDAKGLIILSNGTKILNK